MIPRKTIDLVTETANSHIVDIVGERVDLRKSGGSYKGCCPFHTEKTPSFIVTPSKGMCYCFGCHKGGNAVKFIMELDKISFPEAIHYLGRKFGIDVEETKPSPEQEQENRDRDNLFSLMEYAARSYEANLNDHGEGEAMGLTYLRHRGIRDDVIKTFRLGYSLNAWDGLMKKALTDGFREEYLSRAGLIRVNEEKGGKYDTFRGRIMFPILNPSGKVIAFSGRLLDQRTKGVAGKYINSPETELFIKSDIVFGIFQAKQEIGRRDKCFLVEGPMDAISMHQAGIANVVATNGTALTPEQVKLIKRFTQNVTILYDGDSAGVKSALRAIDLFLHEGMNVRLLLLPDDDDPDSFARKHPGDEFLEYVQSHETDFVTYKVNAHKTADGNDVMRNSETTHSILTSIAEVQDAIQRELYIKECASLMGVSEQSLLSEFQRILSGKAKDAQDKLIQRQRYDQVQQGLAAPPQPGPMSYAVRQQQPAPQQQQYPAPQQSSEDTEFREVMRFFVTYPQNVIEMTVGQETVQTTVAEFIANAMQADELHSREPFLDNIVRCYTEAPDRTAVDTSYFMSHLDADVTNFIAKSISRPELSEIHSKYTVISPESASLNDLVPRAVKELQMHHLIDMIKGQTALLQQRIAENAPEEEITEIMKMLSQLNEVKRGLCMEIGERVIFR